MSLIISIESATKVCSVALHREGSLLAKSEFYLDKSHSSLLTNLIDDLLKYCQLQMKDLDAVAISMGPGSYTGLRIGTSVAKGLCFGLEIPLIAVNTLEAMALGVNNSNLSGKLLCPMLDARRMEVYTTLLNAKMDIVQQTSAKIIGENSFVDLLKENKILFFGNGAEKCKPVFGENKNAYFLDEIEPSAASVGTLAGRKFLENEFEDLAYFAPFYLKEFRTTTPKAII